MGEMLKIISGGLDAKPNHNAAVEIAKSILSRPGVGEILARGNDHTADGERIILAHAYLDLLNNKRPWERS